MLFRLGEKVVGDVDLQEESGEEELEEEEEEEEENSLLQEFASMAGRVATSFDQEEEED